MTAALVGVHGRQASIRTFFTENILLGAVLNRPLLLGNM
jgi:hypothetical protein